MSFELLFERAVKNHEDGKLDEAEHIYRELLSINPRHADLHYLLGLVAMNKGFFEQAVDYFYAALDLEPDTVPYLFNLALALQEWGKLGEAVEKYEKVEALQPEIPETANNLGNIFRLQNKPQKARAFFNTALDLKPDFAEARNNLGLVESDAGELDNAEFNFKSALEINETFADAWFNLANIERDTERFGDAVEHYYKALELDGSNPRYINSLGTCFERMNKIESAEECYNKAIELRPGYADAHNNRGNILVKKGNTRDAETAFRKAVEIDPGFADAHNNLGLVLQHRGLHHEALECYREALKINPDMAETSNNLGLTVEITDDLIEAIGLYFNAMRIKPTLKEPHFNAAKALYRLYSEHDPKAARAMAENWVRNCPHSAIAKHTLAAFKGEIPENTADETYITEMFDGFASEFDKTLANLDYRFNDILATLLAKYGKTGTAKALDAGCGTGTSGAVIKQYCKELTGVDLSRCMLEKAEATGHYNRLVCDNLTRFADQNSGTFGLVICADTLCYSGDLLAIVTALAGVLENNGRLVATFELASDEAAPDGWILCPTGRFAHRRNYVHSVIEKTGLVVDHSATENLRKENENDVPGLVVVAHKPAQ